MLRDILHKFDHEYAEFFGRSFREDLASNFGFDFPQFDLFEEWLLSKRANASSSGGGDGSSSGGGGDGSKESKDEPVCPYGGEEGPDLLQYVQTLPEYTILKQSPRRKEKRKAYMTLAKLFHPDKFRVAYPQCNHGYRSSNTAKQGNNSRQFSESVADKAFMHISDLYNTKRRNAR